MKDRRSMYTLGFTQADFIKMVLIVPRSLPLPDESVGGIEWEIITDDDEFDGDAEAAASVYELRRKQCPFDHFLMINCDRE